MKQCAALSTRHTALLPPRERRAGNAVRIANDVTRFFQAVGKNFTGAAAVAARARLAKYLLERCFMESDMHTRHAAAPARPAHARRMGRDRLACLALGVAAVAALPGCGREADPLWPGTQRSTLAQASAERGLQRIAEHGCASCHTIPGVRGPPSGVGPPLDGMARRAYVGGVLPNTPDNLVRWLEDPPAIDFRTAMPDVGLSHAEAADIAAYLLTLQ